MLAETNDSTPTPPSRATDPIAGDTAGMPEAAVARVKVFVRVRPPNAQEASSKNGGAAPALAVFPAAAEVEVVDASALACVTGGSKRFTFDGVFGADGTQETVFESIGRPTVERVLAGFNGTILAYGQTSSGKTHTMMGPGGGAAEALRSEQRGLTPRVLDLLMGSLAAAPEAEASWTVQMSACELYNEELFDLCLGDGDTGGGAGGELRIREDRTSGRGVYVENLKTTSVRTAADALQVMMRAAERKHMGGTNSNETSSRSHTIVQLMVEQVNHVDGGTRTLSQLFLVDLAGSERLDKSFAVGQRLKEAQNINLSLTLLGNVINKLTDGKALHIPYRDSKLTRLLQDSLGGNAMTTLLCACSPASLNGPESVSTLQFAMRAKRIENKPRANKILSDDELRRAYNKALDEIRVLKDTLNALRRLRTPSSGRLARSGPLSAPPVGVQRPPSAAPRPARGSPVEARGSTDVPPETEFIGDLNSATLPDVGRDEVKELKDAVASLLLELQVSRDENRATDARAVALADTVAFYRARHADLSKQLVAANCRVAAEQQAGEKLKTAVSDLQLALSRLRDAAKTAASTTSSTSSNGGNGPAPVVRLSPLSTVAAPLRASSTTAGRTATTGGAVPRRVTPSAVAVAATNGASTTPILRATVACQTEDCAAPKPPPHAPVTGVRTTPTSPPPLTIEGVSAESAQSHLDNITQTATPREQFLLSLIDAMKRESGSLLKYKIIIERLNKELQFASTDADRKLAKLQYGFEAMLARKERLVNQLQFRVAVHKRKGLDADLWDNVDTETEGVSVDAMKLELAEMREERADAMKRNAELAARNEYLIAQLHSAMLQRS